MAIQTLRPTTDVAVASWFAVPALGTGEGYASRLGEVTRNDATYVESVVAPSALVFAVELGLLQDPGVGFRTGYAVSYVLSTAGGALSSSFLIEIRQVGVSAAVATWTELNVPASPTLFTRTLTDPQIATIDYAKAIRLWATVSVA